MPPRAGGDGATMFLRFVQDGNTRRDPSFGPSRAGDQARVAEAAHTALPWLNRQGRHRHGRIRRRRAAMARQPILQRCARATTMQPYAPPSSASPCLEQRSRSRLPRGWRVTISESHPKLLDARRHPPIWRREIIPRPRGMTTETRAALTDALREAHHSLDESDPESQPIHRIAGRARRQN